jgi:hypothetical protein
MLTSSFQVFVGDKTGHIGLWNATNAGKPHQTNGSIRADDEDDEEEESKGTFWHWQGHLRNTVSTLKFAPNDLSRVRLSLTFVSGSLITNSTSSFIPARTTAHFVELTLKSASQKRSSTSIAGTTRALSTHSTSTRRATRSGVGSSSLVDGPFS